MPIIEKATHYVNNIEEDKQLECVTTILYILDNNIVFTEEEIIQYFKNWSVNKTNCFSDNDIKEGIDYLYETNMIEKSLIGFRHSAK